MKNREQGMTLIVTLIILVLVTTLGITALRMGFMQNSISFNSRVATMAFQGAEAGLRENVSEALSDTSGGVNGLLGEAIDLAASQGDVTPGGIATCPSGSTACVVYRCLNREYADSSKLKRAACDSTDRMDSTGRLRVETQTRLSGQMASLNSSVNSFTDYQFETQANGCLPGGSGCLGESVNVQEYARMAPQDQTSTMN